MADYEEEIPLSEVDISENKISRVFIEKENQDQTTINSISGITIDKTSPENDVINRISAISLDLEEAGHNTALFL